MKNLKTIALAAAMFVATAGVAQQNDSKTDRRHRHEKIQSNRTPDEQAKHEAERATKRFALTADQNQQWQTAALKRINTERPILEQLKGSTTPEQRGELRSQMKSARKQFHSDVQAFLTDEQKETWKKEKEERMKKHPKHKGKRD